MALQLCCVAQMPERQVSAPQHDAVAQLWPAFAQVVVLPQTPLLHARPEQQGVVELQVLPDDRHVGAVPHVPPLQVPLQQGAVALHALPVAPQLGALTQVPPEQLSPLQQGELALQVCPGTRQLTP